MLDVGERVKDYTLKRFLGGGTFGDVWLAEKRLELSDEGILFALKFLPDQTGDGINSDGVRHELNTWIKAGKHPNIVRVYDGFAHGRYLVIVSEYVEGGSLRDWLAAHGRKAPSLAAAVEMLRGILRGLSHLHARKIVHRDLKPENILLDAGAPAITDFGVSRMVETFSRSATLRPTGAAGSPAYMPPEAFGEASPLPPLDTWSAGVIFYEMLSGAWPFQGNSMYALFAEITGKAPRPLPEDVPRELQAFVSTALLKDAAQRFQTAEQMSEALDRAWAALDGRRQWLSETVVAAEAPLPEEAATEQLPSAEDFIKRGDECYGGKDYDGAIQNYDKAIGLNPLNAGVYHDRGNCYYYKGDHDRAFVDYNKAIQLNPNLASAYINRGNIYYRDKEYDQALMDYNRAIQANPQYAVAYYKRAGFYWSAYRRNIEDDSNYDRAIRDFSKAVKLNPRYADAYAERGYAYYWRGKYAEALSDYDKAVELDQRHAEAYLNRSVLRRRHGNYDQSIADAGRAIELNPQHASAYYHRGLAHQSKGDHGAALEDFGRAVDLDPQDAYHYLARAQSYAALSQQAGTWSPQRREYKARAKADRRKYEELYKASHEGK